MTAVTSGFLGNLKQDRLYPGSLLVLVMLLYGRTLGFEFLWDDLLYVLGSEAYRSFDLRGILLGLGNGVEYLPVRDLTFVLDFQLWGERPFGFHLANIIFYAATAIAVYFVTQRLLMRLRPEVEPGRVSFAAFITAGLFALHPLHVEPVCFVNGRNTLVSGMFFFLSMLAYLNYLQRSRWHFLLLSLLFFILAIFSKATAIVLPLVLTLIVLVDGRDIRVRILELAPFFLLAAFAFVLFKEIAQSTFVIAPEQSFQLSATSFDARLATALQIPFFYATKFFLPIGLSVDYVPKFSSSVWSPGAAASGMALLVFLYAAFRLRQIFPEGIFALVTYIMLLLPVMNFFLTSPVVADRYAFLPIYPLVFACAPLMMKVLEAKGLGIALLSICTVLGLVSWDRTSAWETDEALWKATLEETPDSALAHFNLSNNYFDQGRYDLALQAIDRFALVNPYSIIPETMQARVEMVNGNYIASIEILEKAINEKKPTTEAYTYLAAAYEATGRLAEANIYYRKVLQSEETGLREHRLAKEKLDELRPLLMSALNHEAESLGDGIGDFQESADIAFRLDAAGLDEEALELYQEIEVKHGANWAMSLNMGNIFRDRRDYENAAESFRKSIELNPENPRALNGLGLTLWRMDDHKGAERAFLEAIRVAPEFDKAPFNLAVMYLQTERKDEARSYLEYVKGRFPEHANRVEAYLSRLVSDSN